MKQALALLATALAAACATSKAPEPPRPEVRCPPSITAQVQPEPVAPADALVNEAATVWIASELLPWARTNADRLSAARDWCLNGRAQS